MKLKLVPNLHVLLLAIPLAISISSWAGTLTQDEAQIRSAQVSDVSYALALQVGDQSDSFQGKARVEFTLLPDAAKASKDLFIDFEGGTVLELKINGKTAAADEIKSRYDGGRLHFKTDELTQGRNAVEVEYSRHYSEDVEGLFRTKDSADGTSYVYTDLEPFTAHYVFPSFDQPDLKADYTLEVDAPASWQVIANTRETSVKQLDSSTKRWTFPRSARFSTYLFAVFAGPFVSWEDSSDGIPLRLFARKSSAQYVDYDRWFDTTKKGMRFFTKEFGQPYPFGKYDQILAPDYTWGGMENVAAITYPESRFVFRAKATQKEYSLRDFVILHELSHMWFGNLVTMKWWDDLWLNEAFAELYAAISADEALSSNTAWKDYSWQTISKGSHQDDLVSTHSVRGTIKDTDEAMESFDDISYGKGGATLRQLRYLIGENNFRKGLRIYFKRFAYSNTTIDDFFGTLSAASGHDLQKWQDQWLQTSGLNIITARWSCAPAYSGGPSVLSNFRILQGNSNFSSSLREHRGKVTLLYRTEQEASPRAMVVGSTVSTFYGNAVNQVPALVGKPCPDFVLLNAGEIDFAKVRLDPKSVAFAKQHLSEIADPYLRQQIWNTLWQMTVDAKISAQDFAETALNHLRSETDNTNLSITLSFLASTDPHKGSVLKYLSPTLRSIYQPRIEQLMIAGLRSADPGSDAQITWLRGLLSTAKSTESTGFLTSLLKGTARLPGLELKQDRRWEILFALARNGVDGVSNLIESEARVDVTDSGANNTLLAKVQIPDSSQKKQWLDRIVGSLEDKAPAGSTATAPGLTMAQVRVAITGFHQLDQEALSSESVDEYFTTLRKLIAKDNNGGFVSRFANFMFPSVCSADVVHKANEFLTESSKLPVAIKKSLKANIQEEQRCIRARLKSDWSRGR